MEDPDPEKLLGDEKKPSLEQTAWVIANLHIAMNRQSCTYRGLIYGLMDYDESAYMFLLFAGLMDINNGFFDLEKARPWLKGQADKERETAAKDPNNLASKIKKEFLEAFSISKSQKKLN